MREPAALRGAAMAQAALGLYLQLIEWVPMPPWNDLSRGNGQEALDAAFGVATVVGVYGTLRGSRAALGGVAVALMAWAWLQWDSWWRPYLFGATPAETRFHTRWFGATWKVLPAIGDRPVPDAAHLVLHLLIACAFLATTRAIVSTFRSRCRNSHGATAVGPGATSAGFGDE